MNDKQKRFADEYLIDFNASKAAVRAGYSDKNPDVSGANLMAIPEVKEYIEKRKLEIDDELGLSALWVKKRFKEISDRCMEQEPVFIFNGEEWIESGTYKFDSSGANKATESLGKIIGAFEKDNSQKKTDISINISNEDADLGS